ncbi:MAG: DNA damage-inducible protein 1 [Vezdaea aestivalis]|nr:MAG: DNA damage-inducible protein 1 [Vezdaea aestivalis]
MDPSMTAGTLKALVEADTNAPPSQQSVFYNGQPLTDDEKTLGDLGVHDGDMLALRIREANEPQTYNRSFQDERNAAEPERARLAFSEDPRGRSKLQERYPELAAVMDDPEQWRTLYMQMKRQEADTARAHQVELDNLNRDPFNETSQRRIAEIIRERQVMQNLQNAMDNNPESFGKVNMLYIDVEVNGHKVKAFVDSGAQATIVSPSCAERCNIMWLVDARFAGVAYGVGTAKVLGRVHSAQIKIGNLHLPCSFTVMEGKEVELLLGLDMLKRHQACIDLKQNKLILMGTEVPFLSEADSPKDEDRRRKEPTIEGPAGTAIGARSGALTIPNNQSGNTPAGPSSTTSAAAASSARVDPGRTEQPSATAAAAAAANRRNQQPAPSQARKTHSEEKISQLTSLGFSKERAVAALDSTDGHVEFAAGLLFDEG